MKRLLSKIRPDHGNENGNDVRVLGLGSAGTRSAYVITTAERAPCTCPDTCERDHDNE